MKTLGYTGLMPEKLMLGDVIGLIEFNCGFNQAIKEISALPILAVVKKAVEMGLVEIEECGMCRGSGDLITDFSEYDICKNCSGNGFTITEGK